jgi:Ca-activated chloride channel homolog
MMLARDIIPSLFNSAPRIKLDDLRRLSVRVASTLTLLAILLVLFPAVAVVSQSPQSTPTPPATSTPPPAGQEVSEDDVVKVETNLVTSNALVIGRDRKFVPNLRREDFRIFENGVEQEIAFFAPIDRPFDVALIIDNSRSADFELRHIKEAAVAFVNEMRSDDRAAIISLNDDFRTVIPPSSDREALKRVIDQIRPAGNTRLYDAVNFAVNKILVSGKSRKAIVLLTDGVDNDSRFASYQSNLDDLASSGVQLYAVQFSTYKEMSKKAERWRRQAPEGSGFSYADYQRADAYLHQVTELTGTVLYPVANFRDLDTAIAGIAHELHNEYTIGFYPRASAGNRGEIRRLEVRVSQPWLTVRARSSYSFSGASVAQEQARPVMAPLSQIESLVDSHGIAPAKRPVDARWICKQPFAPGDFALVQEGYDSNCPPSLRANDKTNSWYVRKPGLQEVICKGYLYRDGVDIPSAPIPVGFAVVAEAKSDVCSQSNDPAHPLNAWRIKRPTSEETICKGFPIPRGFIVVNEKKQASCPLTTRAANAWIIIPAYQIDNRKILP